MTEPSRTQTGPAASNVDALRERQARWRSGASPQSRPASRRIVTGAVLAVAALAALVLSTALVIAPLFSWQTAGVALIVDDYGVDLLPTVPFARQDTTALAASLSGRLAPSLSSDLLQLKGFETVEAMRDRLHGFCVKMPIRGKDSMIGYIRGQCLVPPPLLDADGNERPDPLAGHACLVAADATLRGEGLREMVPIREIVESIGSAASLTTLVAIDLGNIRWDPRIGVLCGLVPRQLDRDLEAPQTRANGQNWVIASHDTLQYSGASGEAKRTFFAAALEQGLAGAADLAPWGDGDRVVELHELAPFVVAWTSEWSRRSTSGRVQQRPAVWKLGAGRVELRDIPRSIKLVRVSPTGGMGALATLRRLLPGGAPVKPPSPITLPQTTSAKDTPAASSPESGDISAVAQPAAPVSPAALPPSTASSPPPPAQAAGTSAATPVAADRGLPQDAAAAPEIAPQTVQTAEGTSQAPGSTPPPASPPTAEDPSAARPPSPQHSASAAAGPKPPARDDPWELLKPLITRVGPPPTSAPRPSIVDYAPHLWRQAARFVAVATTETGIGGPFADRPRAALQRFNGAMAHMHDTSPSGLSVLAGSPQAEALAAALQAANASGIPPAWSNAPKPLRAAIAARNDAVDIGWSILDVIGRLSGGASPPSIDPVLLKGFVDRISRLSDAIAQSSPTVAADGDNGRLDPLTIATQNMLSQSALIRMLQDQLIDSLTAEAGSPERIPLNERMILLQSLLPDASQRARLLPTTPDTAGVDEKGETENGDSSSALKADGRPLLPPAGPRTIDRAAWIHCATLATSVVDLAGASGINAMSGPSRTLTTLQPTLNDLASARRAIAALENAAGDEAAASEAAAKLSSRLTRLFERAAVTASRISDTENTPSNQAESERLGGLLRMIDPRDAGLVGNRLTIGLPRRGDAALYGLRIVASDPAPPRLGIATTLQISVTDAAAVPAATAFTLGFDPAQVAVRLPDGTKLNEGVAIPVHDLPWRGGVLAVQAVPLRRATTGGRVNETWITAMLATDDYVEKVPLSLPLPGERSVLVAARGAAGSIAGIPGEDGWVRASRPSQIVRDVAVDEATTSLLSLNGQASRVTGWHLGLDAGVSDLRKVDVELHSIPVTRSPAARRQAWADAEAAILAGRFTGKPLARATGVELGAGSQVVPLILKSDDGPPEASKKPPDPSAPQPLPGPTDTVDLAAQQHASATGAGLEIGPDLALVVHDPHGPAGARPMVTRISLDAQHPRDTITAVARYDDRAHTIAVSLEPVGGDASLFPADGIRVTLKEAAEDTTAGGGRAVSAAHTVVPRKSGAVLTAAAPKGDVIASWNGPDQGTARFSLDVDGYPRAFTFAVDCSSASHLRPQGPQHDWRQIRIIAPTAGTTLLKAPVVAVPMRLAVDAPADTFSAGSGVGNAITIVLRQIGGGLEDHGEERIVWSAANARQVTFTLAPPTAGTSLAVRTVVDDWTIAASGEGFANVDVSAEARLVIAGSPSALVDSRVLVFDGRAPVIDSPPSVRATVGKPLVVPIQVSDDSSDGHLIPPEQRRPGVSGLKTVEWAIDADGTGAPKEWLPAVRLGGTNYELRIDSAKLPFGVRLPVLVRAIDAVGLSDPPTRIWLEVGAEAASKLNSLTGKVLLSGRGEPDLPVVLSGPGGDRTVKTRQGGAFRFDDLEPGQYKVSVQAAVRNRMRKVEPTQVTIEAAPAPPTSISLELK